VVQGEQCRRYGDDGECQRQGQPPVEQAHDQRRQDKEDVQDRHQSGNPPANGQSQGVRGPQQEPDEANGDQGFERAEGLYQPSQSRLPSRHAYGEIEERRSTGDAVENEIEDIEIAQPAGFSAMTIFGRKRSGQNERHALLFEPAMRA
jgi:hypothetical protein